MRLVVSCITPPLFLCKNCCCLGPKHSQTKSSMISQSENDTSWNENSDKLLKKMQMLANKYSPKPPKSSISKVYERNKKFVHRSYSAIYDTDQDVKTEARTVKKPRAAFERTSLMASKPQMTKKNHALSNSNLSDKSTEFTGNRARVFSQNSFRAKSRINSSISSR